MIMTIEEIKEKGKVFIKSQIKNDFLGFNDEMLFQLYNGQTWIQKNFKYWHYHALRPRITIYILNDQFFFNVDGRLEFVEVRQCPDVQEATIVSNFNGWSGDTIFEMDNGQTWKQDGYASHSSFQQRPSAIIFQTDWGHKMIVGGEKVKVKRIK